MIPPLSKEFQYSKFDNAPVDSSGMIKLLRRQSSLMKQPEEAKNMVWKDIREGLKLRNIIKSKRVNEYN